MFKKQAVIKTVAERWQVIGAYLPITTSDHHYLQLIAQMPTISRRWSCDWLDRSQENMQSMAGSGEFHCKLVAQVRPQDKIVHISCDLAGAAPLSRDSCPHRPWQSQCDWGLTFLISLIFVSVNHNFCKILVTWKQKLFSHYSFVHKPSYSSMTES